MSSLAGRTIVVTGASRGIGRAIALRAAADGANLVIAAKSDQPHPKLPGTIHSVAAEVEAAGGRALPLAVDVRSEDDVRRMAAETIAHFGGIDCLVNNAGAISLTSTADTPIKRYDLMQQINARAVFLVRRPACASAALAGGATSSICRRHCRSTPSGWRRHLAYTTSKYGMTLGTLGLARELAADGIAVNSLWPRTIIDTAAIDMLIGAEGRKHCRTPQIVADAAWQILTTPGLALTGQTLLDEDFLRTSGVTDFSPYACVPGESLLPDLFVE